MTRPLKHLLQIRRNALHDPAYVGRLASALSDSAIPEGSVELDYFDWDGDIPRRPDAVDATRRLFRIEPKLLRKLDRESLDLVRICFHDIESVEDLGGGRMKATMPVSYEWIGVATVAGVPINP